MRLQLAGRNIAYDLLGAAGAPVVCMTHSLASDGGMWAEQVPPLLAAGFRVLRIDMRGHGGSDPVAGDYTMSQLAGDVAGVLDALGLARVHYIGLSIGGMLGQALAIEHPHRVISAMWCDTLPSSPNGAAQAWADRMRTVREANSLAPLAVPTMERWFTDAFKPRNPGRWKEIHDTIVGTTPAGYLGCSTGIQNFDFTAKLPSLKLPVLVVVGDGDAGTPPAGNKLIADLVPGARYAEIKNARHFPNVEHPNSFNRLMMSWFWTQRGLELKEDGRMRMAGKVGLVTAAASGMGRAGAIRFAREGAAVGVVDIDEARTDAVVREITAAGGKAIAIAGDLRQDAFAREIVHRTVKAFGGLDFVWNHVGHPGPAAIEGIEWRDFDLAMDLNLRTVLVTTEAALPELRARGGGSILFTASTSGLTGSQFSPVYNIAKFGVVGLMHGLAKRYAREKIRVNAVCPGPTDTPMLRVFVARPDSQLPPGETPETLVLKRGGQVPMGRPAQPEEIANAALFLLSDEASYITGVALPVDGGATA